MEKTDFEMLSDYKKLIDEVEKVYGERSKSKVLHVLNTKAKDDIKKAKKMIVTLGIVGLILSPILIGIPFVIISLVCYFKLYKKAVKTRELAIEMAEEDPLLT